MSKIVDVGIGYETTRFDADAEPAVVIAPGETVRFATSGEVLAALAAGAPPESLDLDRANSVTGPVAVEGAQPGDALRVEILDIVIERAWAVWLPGLGPLGDLASGLSVRELAIDGDRLVLADGLSVAIAPMIGCIGVAPAKGVMSTMRPVYPTGGNMDLRELSAGATLWLPVAVPGAMLSLGDLHAAMGHGEPAFVGIEAAGSATVRLAVEHGMPLASPRVRHHGTTYLVGMGESFPAARASAVRQAFELLTGTHGLEPHDAYAYLSAVVALRPGGPSGSMVEGLEAVVAAVPDPGAGS